MKVLMLNGSTRKNGCVYAALNEVSAALSADGIDSEIIQMGARPVHDCAGCGYCASHGRCVYGDDMVNDFVQKAAFADGFVFGSPVYYAHPTGQIQAVLNRAFYSGADKFMYKPAAAIVTARRAGTTASLDALNKYFTDACMPVVSSTYWNMAFGTSPEQIALDEEGVQIMRTVGKNMAWLLKCIRAGGEAGISRPTAEERIWTNFIR